MKYRAMCTVHLCDGCGRSVVQVDTESLPSGYYLNITSVNDDDVHYAEVFVCTDDCILRAFKQANRQWVRNKEK